jgi:hypothetical protein
VTGGGVSRVQLGRGKGARLAALGWWRARGLRGEDVPLWREKRTGLGVVVWRAGSKMDEKKEGQRGVFFLVLRVRWWFVKLELLSTSRLLKVMWTLCWH